jgi:hypothetical protein
MIAYCFPPEGNAGAYRPLRFVRQLPKHGWKATVISAIPSQYERYDPALLRLIPEHVEVFRIKAFDLWQKFQAWRSERVQRLSASSQDASNAHLESARRSIFRAGMRELVQTIEASWYHPDRAMPWIHTAVRATIALSQRRPIDVIWATAGPVSSFLVAQRSSIRTGIPYVLDFRDAWTICHNDFDARKPIWATRLYRQRMYHLFEGAQAVVFRYRTEAECYWRAYPGALKASKIYIIPNGYESPIEPFVAAGGEKCTILYTGIVADYRYDTLLKAISLLKQADPALGNRLCLHFIGEGMEILAKDAGKIGISDIVQTSGPKPYAEIAGVQKNAHALLVLGRPANKPGYELFAGAKLFGYLKAGHPIVGVLPADETKKVLHDVGATTIADVNSVPEIAQVLRNVMDHWSSGTLSSLVPDRKACEAYSSERQTEILVRALEGMPAEEPFVPGQQQVPPSLEYIVENRTWLNGT